MKEINNTSTNIIVQQINQTFSLFSGVREQSFGSLFFFRLLFLLIPIILLKNEQHQDLAFWGISYRRSLFLTCDPSGFSKSSKWLHNSNDIDGFYANPRRRNGQGKPLPFSLRIRVPYRVLNQSSTLFLVFDLLICF